MKDETRNWKFIDNKRDQKSTLKSQKYVQLLGCIPISDRERSKIQRVTYLNRINKRNPPPIVISSDGSIVIVWANLVKNRWNVYLSKLRNNSWSKKKRISSGIKDSFHPVSSFNDLTSYIAWVRRIQKPIIRYIK